MESRATACSIRNDGIDVRGEGPEVVAGIGSGGFCLADMPGEGSAAFLILWNDHFHPVAIEYIYGGTVYLRSQNLLGTTGEKGNAGTSFTNGGANGWEGIPWRDLVREELQHGPKCLGEHPNKRFEESSEHCTKTEASRVGERM